MTQLLFNIGKIAGISGNNVKVNRYRGIENPFGDIWEWVDGASVFHEDVGGVSKLYICTNPANFADGTATNYSHINNLPVTEGYIKTMSQDNDAVFTTLTIGGLSTTYYTDYYSTPGLVNGWRALLRGANAFMVRLPVSCI